MGFLENIGIFWKKLEYFGKKLEKLEIFWKNFEYFGKTLNILETHPFIMAKSKEQDRDMTKKPKFKSRLSKLRGIFRKV